VVGIGLLTCVAVGIFVFGRKHNTSPFAIGVSQPYALRRSPEGQEQQDRRPAEADATSTTQPNLELSGPQRFALRKGLLATTLTTSHLPRRAEVRFRARLNDTEDVLELTVTAPTRFEAQTVAKNWAAVFTKARKQDALRKLRIADIQLNRRVNTLHEELRAVDARLVKLMPIVYSGILRYNAPNGNQFTDGVSGPPPVPEQGSTHAFNLANERVQLLTNSATRGQGGRSPHPQDHSERVRRP
jgi:hypothetical protein